MRYHTLCLRFIYHNLLFSFLKQFIIFPVFVWVSKFIPDRRRLAGRSVSDTGHLQKTHFQSLTKFFAPQSVLK